MPNPGAVAVRTGGPSAKKILDIRVDYMQVVRTDELTVTPKF